MKLVRAAEASVIFVWLAACGGGTVTTETSAGSTTGTSSASSGATGGAGSSTSSSGATGGASTSSASGGATGGAGSSGSSNGGAGGASSSTSSNGGAGGAGSSTSSSGATGGASSSSSSSGVSSSSSSSGASSSTSSSGVSSSSSASSSSSSSSGSVNAVTGTFVYTYYGDDNSPVQVPQDLQGYVVDAYVWSGSAWVTYAGSGDTSGNFTIPNVPSGPFMLDVAGTYVYTSARALDLGTEVNGRPNGVGAKGSSIAGAITNVDAWQNYDSIQWYCPNAAGDGGNPNPPPAGGATSLTSSEFAPWYGNLVDGSQGDVLYLTQLSYGNVGSTAASLSLTRFLSFPGLTMSNGATLAANGALTTVPASASASVNLKASQFAALSSQVNAGASTEDIVFLVGTQPGASAAGLFGYATYLYELFAGTTDVDLGSASFGSPFNASWGLIDSVGGTYAVGYTASGATTSTTLYGYVYQTFPAAAGTPTVTPQLSPVQAATIGGKPLTTAQTGVGVTPTVAWSPPSTGTPSAYHVVVYQLTSSGGATSRFEQAEIVTTTTSIVIPPGLLTSGDEYVLVISAVASPIDASTKPFHSSPTLAQADFLSAIVTP